MFANCCGSEVGLRSWDLDASWCSKPSTGRFGSETSHAGASLLLATGRTVTVNAPSPQPRIRKSFLSPPSTYSGLRCIVNKVLGNWWKPGDAFADGSSAPWFFLQYLAASSNPLRLQGSMTSPIMYSPKEKGKKTSCFSMPLQWWACFPGIGHVEVTSQVVPYSTTVRRAFELSGASVFWGVALAVASGTYRDGGHSLAVCELRALYGISLHD